MPPQASSYQLHNRDMDKTILKSGLVALVVALVVAVAVGLFNGGQDGMPGKDGQSFGSRPDIISPYLRWGDVTSYRGTATMNTATTSVCAIQAPAATSTLTFAGWKITTGTTTAATIDIGIGRTAFATSTTLVTGTSVASGANGEAAWSDVTGTTGIMRPNDWLVVKTAGPGLGGYTYTGNCVAEFTVL